MLETLRQVNNEDPDRKCFRMVGGVLVQKTVKDIMPQLATNMQGVRWIKRIQRGVINGKYCVPADTKLDRTALADIQKERRG